MTLESADKAVIVLVEAPGALPPQKGSIDLITEPTPLKILSAETDDAGSLWYEGRNMSTNAQGYIEASKVELVDKSVAEDNIREPLVELIKPIPPQNETEEEDDFEENKLILTHEDMTVSFGDHTVKLTPREYALMAYLHARPGQVISRAELLHELWKDEYARDTNVVDVYVRFLRTKLDEPLGLRLIRAVRGEGYVYAYENEGELLRAAKPDGKEEKEQTDEKGAL